MERQPVDMVRLEQPEEVYEVEAVFGRDASSVFPNMNKDDDPMEALKASIGAKRFVSETELEEIKKARGLSVDDGTAAPDRPLAEILAERKQAKQDAFEDQWKQMKTGKNRPLDPDELEFLETLAQQEADQQRRVHSQEQADLEAYRQAVAAAADAKAAAATDGEDASLAEFSGRDPEAAAAAANADPNSSGGLAAPPAAAAAASGRKVIGPASSRSAAKPSLPVLTPLVRVKPKGAAGESEQRDSKRPKLQVPPQQEQLPAVGLEGLLGGYASDSD